MSSPTHDGRRVLGDVAVAFVLLVVAAAAVVFWFFTTLTLFGESLHPADYQDLAAGLTTCVVLLVLCGVPSLRLLRVAPWVWVLGGLTLLAVALGAFGAFGSIGSAPPDDSYRPDQADVAGSVLTMSVLCSPLVVLLAIALLRARSSRVPRAPRVPSSAPGRPPST